MLKGCNIKSKIPSYMMVGENPQAAKPVFYKLDDVITEKEERDFLNKIMTIPPDSSANQYDILDFFNKP